MAGCCTVVAGGQWGDEAKGKISAYLSLTDGIDVAARAGLGPGAGHTVVSAGTTLKLRQLPAAVIRPQTTLLLGAGVMVNPAVFLAEVADLGAGRRVGLDPRASIIDEVHRRTDREDPHLTTTIGSTGSGHGPCLADRALRRGRLAGEVADLAPYLADVAELLNQALDDGRKVLIEGTNGFLLSVLYGTYPHTVGKDSTAATIAADVGLGPTRIDRVVLAFKAFPTRVGGGSFPTELPRAEIEARGFLEQGTVTGRPRRVGTFDFAAAGRAARINAPTDIALTFLDRIDPDCRGRPFDRLSRAARAFIDQVEDACRAPVTLIGTGPDTFDILDRRGER
ncbi:adenylosuccinate synthetase [Rhodospirillum rubrum]|uniref:adenylosuccinate synthetase n=1 Tax=Rhodospirillum rubrum TaxID=1085 RepID=UPI001905FAED|nr:adenylosuccinate synthetase [Rhodospirillum rubrum]MBK1666083.1 adenylosuccinate synthetase [Rhodospirillum rubrum]MBK1678349.1 adenylosuccinate synthetase [Rhodospirillum rubrum]